MAPATAAAMDVPTPDRRPVHVVLLFIPGNPGLSNYYDEFFGAIESQLSARSPSVASSQASRGRGIEGITILTTNQLGFTSALPSRYAIRAPSYFASSSIWPFNALGYPSAEAVSLDAQLQHKLDLCADVLVPTVRSLEQRLKGSAEVKVVVAGHSVGAYMCLPLLARYGVPSTAQTTSSLQQQQQQQQQQHDPDASVAGRKSTPNSGVTSPASSSSTLVGVASPSAEKSDDLAAAGGASSAKQRDLVIDRAYLLTPTVMHIARSRNGVAASRLRFLPWVSVTVVCIACGLLYLAERACRAYGAVARLVVSDAAPLESSPPPSTDAGADADADADADAPRAYRSPLHNLVRKLTTMTTDASVAVTLDDLVTSPRNAFAALWLGRSEMTGIGEDFDISSYLAHTTFGVGSDGVGKAKGGAGKGGAGKGGAGKSEKYAFWTKFGDSCRALWSIGTNGLSARSESAAVVNGTSGSNDNEHSSGTTAVDEVVGAAKEAVAAVIDEDAWVDPSTRLRLCRSIAPPAMLEQSIESRSIRHAWCTDKTETRIVASHVVDWLVEDCLS